jgi:hypothetical protein
LRLFLLYHAALIAASTARLKTFVGLRGITGARESVKPKLQVGWPGTYLDALCAAMVLASAFGLI